MKISTVSDLHGIYPIMPELHDQDVDLLLVVGDIAGGGITANAQYKSMYKFVKWVKDIAPKKCIITPGNHDFWNWREVFKYRQNSGLINCLIDQAIDYDGLKIYASPWSLPYLNWNWMKDDDRLEIYYDNIPDDTDILMSHGPALGICDIPLETTDNIINHTHLGSMSLLKAIWHRNISRVLTGHIHSAAHQDIKLSNNHKTLCSCVSILDEKYTVAYKPKTFTL